jgi:hypothetical protein
MDLKAPIRLLPITDLAGESVKSFVDAEKALLNSMTKARAHVTAEPKTRRKAAKPAPRAKAKKATPAHKKAARAAAEETA